MLLKEEDWALVLVLGLQVNDWRLRHHDRGHSVFVCDLLYWID
jgi:hypothetical protein